MRKQIVLFQAVLLFVMISTTRADVSVSLRLDRNEATTMDSVRMVVSISGSRESKFRPEIRGLDDFTSRPGGTSSRVEIVNGKINAGIDYTYYIRAKRAGTFRIGPAEVKVGGKPAVSNTATLVVKKISAAVGADRGPLFLNTELSPKEIYVEEQAIYVLKLYRQAQVKDISLRLPEAEHLAFKQLGKPIEYPGVVDGKQYQILEVRYALASSREGDYSLGPASMNMTVIEPRGRPRRGLSGDPFLRDPFSFFTSGRPAQVAGEPVALKVIPFPDKGKPADFSGLVGSFKMESRLEPGTIKSGESATLTVQVSGRGNLQRIPDLNFPPIENTKVYADEPVLKMELGSNGLEGSKIMKWALVPEKKGHVEIPSLKVNFLDTGRDQYNVLMSPPYRLSVQQGEEEQLAATRDIIVERGSDGPAKVEVKELGRDILPVHVAMRDFGAHRFGPGGWLVWLVIIGPAFFYLVAFSLLRFQSRSERAQVATRARRAAREFVKQYHKSGHSNNGVIQLSRNYLNQRFNLSLGTFTPDEATVELQSRGVGRETSEQFQRLLRRLEDAVYTGKGQERADMGEELPRIIGKIEKELR